MGIRFKYQAGAGIIGAYAAGQAEAGRRRERHGMAMLMQQRQHQNRMTELGARYGGALSGRRAAGRGGGVAEAPQGQWWDPLSGTPHPLGGKAGPDMGQAGLITDRAARRARDRKNRLGKGSQWDPVWVPQGDIDAFEDQQMRDARSDAYFVPDTPKHLVGTDAGAAIDKLNKAARELLDNKKFEPDDPFVQDTLKKIDAERDRIIKSSPDPSKALDDFNTGIYYWDPKLGRGFEDDGPGRIPIQLDGGKPVPIDIQSPEQVAAAKEAEAQAVAQQKAKEEADKAIAKWETDYQTKRDTIFDKYYTKDKPDGDGEYTEQEARENVETEIQPWLKDHPRPQPYVPPSSPDAVHGLADDLGIPRPSEDQWISDLMQGGSTRQPIAPPGTVGAFTFDPTGTPPAETISKGPYDPTKPQPEGPTISLEGGGSMRSQAIAAARAGSAKAQKDLDDRGIRWRP